MPEDVKTSAKVRKVIVSCWLDISRIRIRVTRGVVHLHGTVLRLGEDPREPEANEPYLVKLDEQLRQLPATRGITYLFDNWRREPSGTWRFTGKRVRGGKKS